MRSETKKQQGALARRRRSSPPPGIRLAVIGGSGLYEMAALEDAREVAVKTPFGAPSDAIRVGRLGGVGVAFLPRHGRGHRLLPGEINFRANVWALKRLGAELLVSVSAVGGLRGGIRPGDVVVPDQFIDRTQGREATFFGEGVVAHVAFGDPVCPALSALVVAAAEDERRASRAPHAVHPFGTYVCIEGPQFSTRAESFLYRQWNADVVGMTNVPEAKLAREAELCFATLALVTDYDCWNREAGEVDVDEILRVLRENTARAQHVLRAVAIGLPAERSCRCGSALATAIVTERAAIPARARRALAPIIGKYV